MPGLSVKVLRNASHQEEIPKDMDVQMEAGPIKVQ